MFHHPNAPKIAMEYTGTAEPLEELGWGVDGVVYASRAQTTAIKIHSTEEKYRSELAIYGRLRSRGVTEFMGFRVPKLIRHSDRLKVIEMSVVKIPFLLDFAVATMDRGNDFTADAMADWWQQVEDDFGDDFGVARDVFWALKRQHGIYYWDMKPRNLRFR
jgi:hypothetical protein